MIPFAAELTVDGFLLTWDVTSEFSAGTVTFQAGLDSSDLTSYITSGALSGSTEITPEYYDRTLVNYVGRLLVKVGAATVYTSPDLPLFPGISATLLATARRHVLQHLLHCRLHGETAQMYRDMPEKGTACSVCVDPATGERFLDVCATCGGSGRVAGYEGPFSTGILFVSSGGEQEANAGVGPETVRKQAAVLNCLPRPKAGDLLLLSGQGRVLVVAGDQKTLTSVKSVPVTVQVSLTDPGNRSGITKSLLEYVSA